LRFSSEICDAAETRLEEQTMSVHAWIQAAPGVWKFAAGSPPEAAPLSVIGRRPLLEALEEMGNAAFPLEESRIRIHAGPKRSTAVFPLAEDERIYGFGLQFMKVNQRGRTRYLRVNSDPKQDTGETHAPVPFYVSSRGYGVLVNSSRIVTVCCGSVVRMDSGMEDRARDRNSDRGWKATPVSDTVEWVVPGEGIEIYVFSGPAVMDVVRRYNLFSGGGVLPPRWGLGFWHRVPKSFSAEETLAEALEFRKHEVPCDVIGLEPGWHSKSYPVTYEWNRRLFPDPAQFAARMEEAGFKVNLWEHPYVSPDAEIYRELKPLSGSHTVWHGLAPDYTLPEAREIYMTQHLKEHVSIGISGYKLDECDGSELTRNSWMFPAHAEFPSGLDGEQMRQIYGLLFQKMADDMYRLRNRRTYGLVRASNANASSLPSVLYSDLYDHRQFVRALCNASFSGLLWTPEVRKAKDAEEWVRRIQVVCFSPLAMINAWADGTKPWSFPEVEPIVRKYIRLRMRLMPYFYTAFARYKFEGVPPVRAMQLESNLRKKDSGGDELNSTELAYGRAVDLELDDQFMVGDSLLVAPLFAGESSREVYLPDGVWYGLETGERYEGGGMIRVEADLDIIPVFVRDGAILPLMPALAHAPRAGEQVPLELVHFGTAPGAYRLYDDDGETFAYENGEYEWRTAEVRIAGEGALEGTIQDSRDGFHATYGPITWKIGVTALPAEGRK
jgi:alpha-D-xyloside xylohydrolase